MAHSGQNRCQAPSPRSTDESRWAHSENHKPGTGWRRPEPCPGESGMTDTNPVAVLKTRNFELFSLAFGMLPLV